MAPWTNVSGTILPSSRSFVQKSVSVSVFLSSFEEAALWHITAPSVPSSGPIYIYGRRRDVITSLIWRYDDNRPAAMDDCTTYPLRFGSTVNDR